MEAMNPKNQYKLEENAAANPAVVPANPRVANPAVPEKPAAVLVLGVAAEIASKCRN